MISPRRNDRCDEARALLAGGELSDGRLTEHLAGCAACRAHAEHLDRIRAAIRASAQRLDDVARRRIQTRLGEALDREASRRTDARGRTWQYVAAAAAVALAIGVLVGRERWQRPSRPAQVATRHVLVPYSVSGMEEDAAARRLGERSTDLAIDRSGATVRAAIALQGELRLEQRVGQIALIGPGRLALRQASSTQLEVRLDKGLLLADVEHADGRTFRVSAGDVTVTVVGTLFAVDARDPRRVQVAVARGAVVARRGRVLMALSAGQSWRVDDPRASAIAPSLSALLAEHAALSPPRGDRLGILALAGSPADAQAALGTASIGRTPLALLLPAGPASLTLSATRHAPATVRVAVRAGETTRFGFTLSPLPPPESQPSTTRPASTPATTRRPRETAETLYAWAESALRAGDEPLARRVLRELVRRYPRDPSAASARYELARLAHKAGALDEARLHLRELVRGREPTFHDPARYLLCRIVAEEKRNDEAQACLRDFRRDFPSSPHDHEALYLLAQLAELKGGCAAAKPLFDEYLRRYPRAAFASRARARSARCAP